MCPADSICGMRTRHYHLFASFSIDRWKFVGTMRLIRLFFCFRIEIECHKHEWSDTVTTLHTASTYIIMLLSFSSFLLFISYFFTCTTAGKRHRSIIGWHRIFFSSMSVFFFFVTDCLLSHCQRCSSLVLLIYFEKKTS